MAVHHMHTLPRDCVGVILAHVDERTLRSARLVTKDFCAAATIAAKTRACDEAVEHFLCDVVATTASIVIRVADKWEIRFPHLDGAVRPNVLTHLDQFDRGIIREVLAVLPQIGCAYLLKLGLYISYKARTS